MPKKLTLKQLRDKRASLEVEVNETQETLAKKKYAVELESKTNLNAILKQIDTSYEWSIKNAAMVVNLYDVLKVSKLEKQVAERSNGEPADTEGSYVVNLKAIDLNTLYSVLTNITGTGVEQARRFIKLLTNVGSQITSALNEMADSNKEIQAMHVELAELDAAIQNFGKEEVEVPANEVEVPAEEIEITQ
jgi:hypothetical protein